MLDSIKKILSRREVKEELKHSGLESSDAALKMGKIAIGTEKFNTYSKRPGLLARVIAPVYRIFRSSGSKNSVVEEIQPKPVPGVSMLGGEHEEITQVTRERRLDALQNSSEKLSASASEFGPLTKELAKQAETASTKPWYKKGVLGYAISWFQSIGHRDGYDVMSECDSESIISTGKFVHGEAGREVKEDTASYVSWDTEWDDESVRSLTPEPSEKEKIGFVQGIKNMLTTTVDFFMSPFRAKESATVYHIDLSSGKDSQPREETSPPTYEQAMEGDATEGPNSSVGSTRTELSQNQPHHSALNNGAENSMRF